MRPSKVILPLIILVFFGYVFEVFSQNTFSIKPKDLKSNVLTLVDVINSSSIGSVPNSNFILFNGFEASPELYRNYLFSLNSSGQAEKLFEVKNKSQKFIFRCGIWANNLIYIVGQHRISSDAYGLYLIALNSFKKEFQFEKLIGIEKGFSAVQITNFGNSLNVSYQIDDFPKNNRIMIRNYTFDGNLNWGSQYFNSLTDREYLEQLIVCPRNNLFFATRLSDSTSGLLSNIRMHKINARGVPVESRKFTITNNGTEVKRFGKIFLKTNNTNLHLATQEIIGRDGHGKITITMIDSNLNLRTWRNYSGEMVLEDFRLSPGRFLLSGQRPINNGKEGYAIASINSANAIPEVLSIYSDGFYNSSLASDSRIGTTDTRTILLIAKPNKSDEKGFSVAVQRDSSASLCNQSYIFEVTKDNITLDLDEVIGFDSLMKEDFTDDLNFSIEEIEFDMAQICSITNINVIPNHKPKIQIYSDEILVFAKNEKISIYSIEGKCIQAQYLKISADLICIKTNELPRGIYFMQIGKYTEKFVKQ